MALTSAGESNFNLRPVPAPIPDDDAYQLLREELIRLETPPASPNVTPPCSPPFSPLPHTHSYAAPYQLTRHPNEPMHSQHRMRSFSPPDRHSPQTPPLQLPRSHILLPLAAHEALTSPAYPSPIASSSNAYLCPRPCSLSAPSRSAYPDTVPYRSTDPSACSHSTYPTEFGDGAARHAAPSSLLKNENYAGQARGSPPGLALHDLSRSAISPGVFGGAARGPPGYYQLPYETAPSSAARQYLPTYSPLREALPIDPVVTRACPNVYMPRDAFDYHASRMRKFFMRKDRGIVP